MQYSLQVASEQAYRKHSKDSSNVEIPFYCVSIAEIQKFSEQLQRLKNWFKTWNMFFNMFGS